MVHTESLKYEQSGEKSMGYTVESAARLHEHYDTREQVDKALERLNRG